MRRLLHGLSLSLSLASNSPLLGPIGRNDPHFFFCDGGTGKEQLQDGVKIERLRDFAGSDDAPGAKF
jgi:hypothetical protein